MKNIKNIQDVHEKPSAIVCIAYHQLSLMCGINNLADPPPATENVAETARNECSFAEEIPLIGTILTSVCYGYTQIKESNNFLATVFNDVENLFLKGAQFVEPIKNKAANAIELPRQHVDSALAVGRDIIEKKVTPFEVTPPSQIIENIQNFFRNSIVQPMKCLIAAVKNLGITQGESNGEKGTNGKQLKGND